MSKLSQYTWELPQNLVGLFVKYCFGTKPCCVYEDAEVRYWPLSGSISLGERIFLDKYYEQNKAARQDLTIKHEYGHAMQSKKLGWFYLIVIGLPSIVWAGAFKGYRKKNNVSYYSFYTEKWADKLGGVDRGSSD